MKIRKPFSENEISFLKQNASCLTAPEIAAKLNRGVNVIRSKAVKINLSLIAYSKRQNDARPKEGEKFGDLVSTGKHRNGDRQGEFIEVRCPHGGLKFVSQMHLHRGNTRSCRRWRLQCPEFLMRRSPENITVRKHFELICRYKKPNYKDMPFFDSWNYDKGGSSLDGAIWIRENLGLRPKGASLHIIDHAKGFVPGNLEWAYPRKQANQQMFKIIAQQRHEIKELKRQLIEAQQVLSLCH